jgi:acyl dehydratase
MVLDLEYDKSLHEKEHLAGPFEVTKDMIRTFAESIGETNPLFTDEEAARSAGFRGLLAPPTMCTLLVHDLSLPDINLDFGRTRMHAGQRVQTRGPIVAGDSLMAHSKLKNVYAKTGRSGTMVFIVWETIFRTADGEVIAHVEESFARRE